MAFAARSGRPTSNYFRPQLEPGEDACACEFPGCQEDGEYRAPRSPKALREWRWFCLDHVRDYNKAWNYFAGWTEDDIESWRREDLTGHRPTWPIGSGGAEMPSTDDLENKFRRFAREWFGDGDPSGASTGAESGGSAGHHTPPTGEHARALEIFDLDPPFTVEALKRRYKILVKRHHPDANGGSLESEELLKSINQAYTYLLNQLS